MRDSEWSDDDGLPPCTQCGVCCFFEDPRYVMVFEEDSQRLGTRADELTREIGGRRFMRQEQGHCIALHQHGEHWLCSIYEQRPRLCREFERGCEVCRTVVAQRHPHASARKQRLPLAGRS